MTPTFRKVALIAAVLGLVVSVLVAACGSDSDDEAAPATTAPATTATTEPEVVTTAPATTTAPTTTAPKPKPKPPAVQNIRIAVVGGRPQGGIQRPSVKQGRKVLLVVTSDVADEIHLHGYDLSADAGPGKTARIPFNATIPGRFEIELEQRGIQIAELEVRP
jgi:heme/copper-type cytochrome/quinol oxidase subunit 2